MSEIQKKTVKIEEPMTIANIKSIYKQVTDLAPDTSLGSIDLAGVSEIDGSGLQLLCFLQNQAEQNNSPIRLINVESTLQKTIEFTQLQSFFGLSESSSFWSENAN